MHCKRGRIAVQGGSKSEAPSQENTERRGKRSNLSEMLWNHERSAAFAFSAPVSHVPRRDDPAHCQGENSVQRESVGRLCSIVAREASNQPPSSSPHSITQPSTLAVFRTCGKFGCLGDASSRGGYPALCIIYREIYREISRYFFSRIVVLMMKVTPSRLALYNNINTKTRKFDHRNSNR